MLLFFFLLSVSRLFNAPQVIGCLSIYWPNLQVGQRWLNFHFNALINLLLQKPALNVPPQLTHTDDKVTV